MSKINENPSVNSSQLNPDIEPNCCNCFWFYMRGPEMYPCLDCVKSGNRSEFNPVNPDDYVNVGVVPDVQIHNDAVSFVDWLLNDRLGYEG